MGEGPNISRVGALVGDPARAAMLTALLGGMALTAGELAEAAGVTRQTASAHLAQLEDGDLIAREKQGRHVYFRFAGPEAAALVESLGVFAARPVGPKRVPGPRDPALRRARVCYDHLAGTLAVSLFDCLVADGVFVRADDAVSLTPHGARRLSTLGIDIAALRGAKRPLCRACLDWSERRHHLAGALGGALLASFVERHWVRRVTGTRSIIVTPAGERALRETFGVRG
ncbi:helix-turn-helix transcriptional regulator [Acuticoccus sp. I52.16.1]|uniref:ArsR/SmtB family transcription factor n=1 Tax=Acuticoccus sp. I52.16.1 TaxID=2928472 RepID=UPI001FD5DB43|nr:winged helix-turn-helix domain-containing protein [Acuticoccus sp. I52.16.1]UOM36091.1 winged helix-turn-helix domain-containing protein [Acuticoccus sp. I52.16.1]